MSRDERPRANRPALCRRITAAGAVGVILLAGGGAASAVADAPPLIHACVSHGLLGLGQGSIRIVQTTGQCTANESPLSWNQQGVQGPQGIPGPTGPAGPTGPPGPPGPATMPNVYATCCNGITISAGITNIFLFKNSQQFSSPSPFLPSGNYLILAKAQTAPGSGTQNGELACDLVVGLSTVDTTVLSLIGTGQALVLQGTAQLPAGGATDVRCRNTGTAGSVIVSSARLTAIPVQSITSIAPQQ